MVLYKSLILTITFAAHLRNSFRVWHWAPESKGHYVCNVDSLPCFTSHLKTSLPRGLCDSDHFPLAPLPVSQSLLFPFVENQIVSFWGQGPLLCCVLCTVPCTLKALSASSFSFHTYRHTPDVWIHPLLVHINLAGIFILWCCLHCTPLCGCAPSLNCCTWLNRQGICLS